MPRKTDSLRAAISGALLTSDPRTKAMATRDLARAWRLGRLVCDLDPHGAGMPLRPNWPDRPALIDPRHMPRRGKGGSLKGRTALWHALAHIEFIAIDLALDMAGRFGGAMGAEFVSDFLAVAADEAMHFALLDRKLKILGSGYGDLPAHAGLWEAAERTAHDVGARLAIVPMVLEARGLDVTPTMLERVRLGGDEHGAKILQRILDDEIRHVAIGTKHFVAICQTRGESPQKRWKSLVREHFNGALKPPFNDSARLAAGLSRDFYEELAS